MAILNRGSHRKSSKILILASNQPNDVKKQFFAIPVAVAIIAVSVYLFYPHQDQPSQISAQALAENGSPMLGDPNAKITIVEWGDYQCTYCHLFHQNTKDQLIQQYVDTGKVNFVFRDFPLNGPASVLAAEAAYCAGDQGKYWQYHDELYNNWGGENTGWVNQKSLDKFANAVGLDQGQFDQCLGGNKYEGKVLDNQKFGEQIGINATPSFIIFNDQKAVKVDGAQPIATFKQVLDNI